MTERDNQQNSLTDYTPEQKEEYLDNIVTRLSNMEMRGSSLSNKDLLGKDWQKGVEMFGLEQFSKRIQGDIILSLAYYRSDSFKDGAVRSLGYNTVDEMPPEYKEIYDGIVERGQSAYADINFRVAPTIFESKWSESVDTGEEVYVPQKATKIAKELGVVNHELGHHLYNGFYIDPGYHDNEESPSASDSLYFSMVPPPTPLEKIVDDHIKPTEFYNTYKEVMTSKDAREYISRLVNEKELGQEILSSWKNISFPSSIRDEAVEGMIEHDNFGYERAADIHGARMLMLRDGIWNPFSGQPLTEKEMDDFQKKHPYSRIFEYWDKEKAVYFINNIASLQPNDSKTPGTSTDLMPESLRNQINDNIFKELSATSPSIKSGTGSISHPGAFPIHPTIQDNILSSINYDEIISRQESQDQEQHRGHSL